MIEPATLQTNLRELRNSSRWTPCRGTGFRVLNMQKTYSPEEIEQHWYAHWEKNQRFLPNHSKNIPYSIILPPPNVTGTLHMGHGFQTTLMDVLIRYHRMRGSNTLWQMGTDHAGIATQMVVERQLAQAGQTRYDIGREAFVAKTWDWKEQSGQTIQKQLRRMGASLDWSRECFSLDPSINRAVNQVFITLHEQGLIYRGKRLVNWDPVLQTAISDLEVVTHEEQGSLWHICYPLASDSSQHITVATTRPETLLGDVAVAVHPEDSRYQHLIGQQLQLPLTNRTIPVIADDTVDREFGTGCVKITPAHDFNDYAMGQRHGLPLINVLTPTACINEEAPEVYRGLSREKARLKIIQDLKDLDLLEKIEPYTIRIPKGDRSGAVIEPYLTDQWYIHMTPLAEPALEALQKGDIQFVPENWSKTYVQWLENIEDWCISRQLWWGHRIPVWYDEQNQAYVGISEAAVREKHQLGDRSLRQDEDVLDTWFSAGLWPFATLGWPDKTIELETFYTTSVLVTGFDILFFWVARMVMMGLKFTGKVPFKTIYITGLIRDSEGHKMSKSKGNILDPIDLIDGIDLETLVQKRLYGMMQPEKAKQIEKTTRAEFPEGISPSGTDALRFTYCALANTGRDIRFDVGRLEGYRHFCNKLWNAARYVLMTSSGSDPCHSGEGGNLSLIDSPSMMEPRLRGDDSTFDVSGDVSGLSHCKTATRNDAALAMTAKELGLPDRWILSKLQETIQTVTQHFEQYRFDLLAQALYEFTWNEYCDWYLEFSKPVLTGADVPDVQKHATQQTLIEVLETLLRLIHPVMPFITEDIWQSVKSLRPDLSEKDTIMLEAYPVFNADLIDKEAEADVEWLKKVSLSLRQIRSKMNISPKIVLPLLLRNGQRQDKIRWERNEAFLKSLTNLGDIQWIESSAQTPPAAIALVDELELLIPLEGLIDKTAELARLEKESQKWEKEQIKLQAKLDNPNYVSRAPAAIVEQERMRVVEIQAALSKIKVQKEKLS